MSKVLLAADVYPLDVLIGDIAPAFRHEPEQVVDAFGITEGREAGPACVVEHLDSPVDFILPTCVCLEHRGLGLKGRHVGFVNRPEVTVRVGRCWLNLSLPRVADGDERVTEDLTLLDDSGSQAYGAGGIEVADVALVVTP